jgi:hypothetical protein
MKSQNRNNQKKNYQGNDRAESHKIPQFLSNCKVIDLLVLKLTCIYDFVLDAECWCQR